MLRRQHHVFFFYVIACRLDVREPRTQHVAVSRIHSLLASTTFNKTKYCVSRGLQSVTDAQYVQYGTERWCLNLLTAGVGHLGRNFTFIFRVK